MAYDPNKLSAIFEEWMTTHKTMQEMSDKHGISRTTLSDYFTKRLTPKREREPKPER